MELFNGYDRAYGTYQVSRANDSGKVQGEAVTHKGTPTPDLFARHLMGKGPGLGIIMLRADDTVAFGVIDNDDRRMDHKAAVAKIRRYRLPLMLCRSKSGGGHFYCFTEEPVDASVMVARLTEWAALLGVSRTAEIFPKQTVRLSEKDVGNWINIPYYGGDGSPRAGVRDDGSPMSLEEFITDSERARVPVAVMNRPYVQEHSELFVEAPPCLSMIHAQGGFVDGTKKDGMFSMGVYLKKRFPDDWENRMPEYNAEMANLKFEELSGLIRQLGKKDYSYKCKLEPLVSVCNRRECLRRRYGVGEGSSEASDYDIGGLIRYEPPDSELGDEVFWRMELNGKPVQVNTRDFLSPQAFMLACLEQANVVVLPMPVGRWHKRVAEMQQNASIVKLPLEATQSGQILLKIKDFVSTGHADSWEAMAVTQASYVEEGRAYFRSADLFRYLEASRVPWGGQTRVWRLVEYLKGGEVTREVDGKRCDFWWVPATMAEAPSRIAPSLDRDTPF